MDIILNEEIIERIKESRCYIKALKLQIHQIDKSEKMSSMRELEQNSNLTIDAKEQLIKQINLGPEEESISTYSSCKSLKMKRYI